MSLTIARIRSLFSIVDPAIDELLARYDQDAELNASYVSILNAGWLQTFVTKDIDKDKIAAFLDQLIADDVEGPCLLDLFLESLAENHELKQILHLHTYVENEKLASFSSIEAIKKKVNATIDVYIKNILENGDAHTVILQILNAPVLRAKALELHSDLLIFDGHTFTTARELAYKLDRSGKIEIDASSWELQKLLAEIASKKFKSNLRHEYEKKQQNELLEKCDAFLRSTTPKQKEIFFREIHIKSLIAYIQDDYNRIGLLIAGVSNDALFAFCNRIIPNLRDYPATCLQYIPLRSQMINILGDQLTARQSLTEQEKQQIIMLLLQMILEYPSPQLSNSERIPESADHYTPDSKTKALFFIGMLTKIEEHAKPSLIDSIVKQYGGSSFMIDLDIKLINALLAKGCDCDLELAVRECGKEGLIAILDAKQPSIERLEELLIHAIKNKQLMNSDVLMQRLLRDDSWKNISLISNGDSVWDGIDASENYSLFIKFCSDEQALITLQNSVKSFVNYLCLVVFDITFHLKDKQKQADTLYKFLATQQQLCKEIHFELDCKEEEPERYRTTCFIDVDKSAIDIAVENNNTDFVLLLLKRVYLFPTIGSDQHRDALKDSVFTLYQKGCNIQPIVDYLRDCRGILDGALGGYNPFKSFEEKLLEQLEVVFANQSKNSALLRFSSKGSSEQDGSAEKQPLLTGLRAPGV